jgi:hypothetical protein
MKLLHLLFIIPTIAMASEQQIACNLEKDRSEVQASILSSPQIFGSVGDVTSEQNAVIGVSQSFSGIRRARLMREAAESRCNALRATVSLDRHGIYAVTGIQQKAASSELIAINNALGLAIKNMELLDAQLAAQAITVIQYNSAKQVILELNSRKADLIRLLGKQVEFTDSVAGFVDAARIAEANAARLSAEAISESGWDVKVSAGARQSISGNTSTKSFATLTFTYSFGYSSSREAARRVGLDTEQAMSEMSTGYARVIHRQRNELEGMIVAEEVLIPSIKYQLGNVESILKVLEGVETKAGINTKRELEIQKIVLNGRLVGSEIRRDGYKSLLADLR